MFSFTPFFLVKRGWEWVSDVLSKGKKNIYCFKIFKLKFMVMYFGLPFSLNSKKRNFFVYFLSVCRVILKDFFLKREQMVHKGTSCFFIFPFTTVKWPLKKTYVHNCLLSFSLVSQLRFFVYLFFYIKLLFDKNKEKLRIYIYPRMSTTH